MAGPLNIADALTPPEPSTVYQFATSTTHAINAIPTAWKERYVTIFALTADAYILFGTSASIEVDRAASPTNDTGATYGKLLSTANLAGYPFYVNERLTHFTVEAGASGTIRVEISSPQMGNQGVGVGPKSAAGGA